MIMDTSLPYHIIIDSIPKDSLGWIQLLSALLTPAIAIVVAYSAIQQAIVNRRRYRFEIYERRLVIYKEIQIFLKEVVEKSSKIDHKRCLEFSEATAEAAFLLDKNIQKEIDEIFFNAANMVYDRDKLERIWSGPELSEQERDIISKEYNERLKWLFFQSDIVKTLFQKIMALKN